MVPRGAVRMDAQALIEDEPGKKSTTAHPPEKTIAVNTRIRQHDDYENFKLPACSHPRGKTRIATWNKISGNHELTRHQTPRFRIERLAESADHGPKTTSPSMGHVIPATNGIFSRNARDRSATKKTKHAPERFGPP